MLIEVHGLTKKITKSESEIFHNFEKQFPLPPSDLCFSATSIPITLHDIVPVERTHSKDCQDKEDGVNIAFREENRVLHSVHRFLFMQGNNRAEGALSSRSCRWEWPKSASVQSE